MASNKRNNRGRNNNPEGRNQYSNGVLDMARDRPMTAALGAAAAVGAGVFLWSRRNQISDQLSNLSDQLGEWTESFRSGETDQFGEFDDTAGLTTATPTTSTRSGSQRGMSETGGGNASLGRRSGGSGIKANASSRGRARGIPSTT